MNDEHTFTEGCDCDACIAAILANIDRDSQIPGETPEAKARWLANAALEEIDEGSDVTAHLRAIQRILTPPASTLSDAERVVLVREIHGYAEGVEENLRDDHWPENLVAVPADHTFPVVEDYLSDADRIEVGDEPVHDTLQAVADQSADGADPVLVAALAKFGYRLRS